MREIYVGRFTEEDLKQGKDKLIVKAKQEETGFKYTNTKLIKKNGKNVGIDIYVCDVNSWEI